MPSNLLQRFQHLDFYYRAYRYRYKVEVPEIAFVRENVRPGATAVDVGAHKGAYTFWMHRLTGAAGRVFAFEPQPALAQRLATLQQDLALDNVTVEAKGLGSAQGTLTLVVPGGDTPSPGASFVPGLRTGKSLEIPVTTLDAYFATSSVDFIKCDVEGYELDVFKGGEKVLRRDHPTLLFECEERHQREHAIADVFSWLATLGYEGHFFWNEALLPISQFEPKKHQDPSRKPYANNFVFRAPRRAAARRQD